MVLIMLVPFGTVLIPVVASAADAVEEITDTSPKVSLAWDTSTVTVTDGVAMPHKNASATASSYTMSYTVTASGAITNPITVRVQSFDLSASAGKEYATVDTTVTLTAQNPTATGTVTVYTHVGYVTRVKESNTVYTNEFGLRIIEVKNAKKQSGADTLRSQVLAANGYTLDVVRNKDGANYGNGSGTFQNGYVYLALTKDYVKQIINSQGVLVKPDKDQADISFNPYEYLNSQSNDMPKLFEAYPDMKVYYNGTGKITEDSPNKTRYGFFIRITDNGAIVFEQNEHARQKWDDWSFNWLTYSYDNGGHDHPNANGDFNIINTSVGAYHRTASYGDRYLMQSTKNNVIISLNTCNDDLNVSGKKYHDFYFSTIAANNTDVVAENFYIEDRAYGAGDTVYLTVRFNKPVQFVNNSGHPLKIQAKIGSSTSNYFTYCGGSMTDTLIFSMTLPEDEELSGNNIELVGFYNEDYNKNLGDLFWNTSNKNNMWVYNDGDAFTVDSLDDRLVKGKKFVCSVDTRTPDISIYDVEGDSGIVRSASFAATVSNITNQGNISVAWTKSESAPTTEDSWSPITFSVDEKDRATVTLEKKGLTGTYYAHLRALSVSGNQTIVTEGPFTFHNQSPTIKDFRLAVGDNAFKYLNAHTVFFDISGGPVDIAEVYMRASHADGSLGLAGDANEILVYKHRAQDNLLTIENGIAQIKVSTDMLDLADDAFDSYNLSFYAIDALGNQSDVYGYPEALMFDNRDTFEAMIETPADISIKEKEIYYNDGSLIFSHVENAGNELVIYSLKYNGVDITDKLLENGISGVANKDSKKFELYLGENAQGYVEIVFKLGDRWSNVLNFYVTSNVVNSPNYQKLYAHDRLLINEVWQLSTATFYSSNNRSGRYYTGTNVKPIFSSRAKALDYAVYFEKQDVVIEYIDDEVEKINLEDGQHSNYRKADADKDKKVAVGQTWLRYKSQFWTPGSNNEEHWVYYFYSDEKEAVIDPALTPALNAAIDRNAKLICNYDGDNRIYLTANNTSKNYVNSFGEPQYDSRGILTEALSYSGIYSYEIGISADNDIYNSFITYNDEKIPLVANYTFNIDATQHGFVYYKQQGTSEWLPILNGEGFKDKVKASGLYDICEFGNGYMTYTVYVDLAAPVISYEITVDGTSKEGYVTSDTSGGTLRASKFTVKELLNTPEGVLPVEYDGWAYFYVLYSSISGGEHAFMTMNDLNRSGFELDTGIYKIYACDRLGNMVVQAIKINTEDIKVTDQISSSGLTITSNRAPADILPGSFKVWRDNMLLSDVTYAQSLTFARSGEYRIEFEDVYGSTVSKTFSFKRDIPKVSFLREKKAGVGIYEGIKVNSEEQSSLSKVTTNDNQLFVVTTSANIRISYPVSSGYDFEFIGDKPEYKTSILSTSNIDISSDSNNWSLKIFHKNDPDIYILVTCIVDKEMPTISGTVQAKEFMFNEHNGKGNVLFYGTGNTTSKSFYNGERVVGDSVKISWTDDTQVSEVSYTLNGGTPVEIAKELTSIELTDVGKYVFEVKDIYGNASIFEYTFTDRVDFNLTTGEVEIEIKRDPENYIVGEGYTDTVYTGRETRLQFSEEALLALYYTDGSCSYVYNLRIDFGDGNPMLNVLAFDEESGEFIIIESIELSNTEGGDVFDGDFDLDYTYHNGIVTLIMPECQKEYEMWQIRATDYMEHCPVIVQIERSNRVSQINLVKEDGSLLDMSYEGYIGSNQILFLDDKSVPADTVEIVAYYSANYTDSFENAERILLYGKDATPFLDKEGYYRIVSVNKYGNEREYFVAISFKLSLDVHISYNAISSRTETLKNPDAYSIFSNKSVRIGVWEERASVICLQDGNAIELQISRGGGYAEFTLDCVGEYTVIVTDESENTYTLSISIKEPHPIEYGGYITGFNENALKKDQNYTNEALNLDKQSLEADGIKYVAFRRVGTNQYSVLYDVIGINPIEYSQSEYNGIIGREDGEYEILFCDAYGNPCTETVRISRKPMISINRQTQNSAELSPYKFDFALQNGAWSNYLLNFTNTSERYLLKVNGVNESFGENGYTLMLPADLGTADEAYVLEYVDDYGNSYTINVYLHRSVPESQISDGADTVSSGGKMYAKNDFSLIWTERVTASYSLNGGTEAPFEMDKVFTEDGEYRITFVDYAGNTSTRTIIKDSTVLFHVSCGAQNIYSGAVVSSKVTLSLDEAVTYTVTKDGEAYDNSSRSFTEDGHYVITLTDSIGNVQKFTFTIYVRSRQSFTLASPEGYSFSQIWNIREGHKVSLVGEVTLNESGAQIYTFSSDGYYEIELLHMESGEICYFNLTIDNLPPEAVVVGAENGGITRDNVSIEGLKSGDTIDVYQNGELLTSYIVNGDSETTLALLDNGDFGSYRIVIRDEAGNTTCYEFVKEFATNTSSNIFICLLLMSLGAIGIIYIRFNGKVRTK